ncbi:aldehyde dehydrogenase family protein [Streptomyces sp. BK205]|uniref:aldehyde dehydrogenase family protein n=1 Tax=Streptomyces sp. BK205 TaxID=2512164 RepID=UPI00104A1C50|nr:aldehyde dehydrogenase family protein [Streptomyces sp. BK205]TCR16036.1 acyl-CoA reductase-like NAD-dependent aldehyde dehydrogenase [Streptomyces sp. BK205]
MTVPMTIDGTATEARRTLPVRDPATGKVIGQAPECSPEQLAICVDAARAAFRPWAAWSPDKRRAALRACGDVLSGHLDEIARLLTLEQGKPLAQARAEVGLAASWFGQTADLSLPEETPAAGVSVQRVPHGVVAAVTPFNFPIILSVCKIAPALLAGNTVVVKPSPATPLATLRMVQLLAPLLPPGVLSAVSGEVGLGPALTGHPEIDLVSFTGSIEVGRAIAREAGGRLKRVVLELGGNDAAIVLPGHSPADVAPALFDLSMVNSGQFCAAVKRIYVPRAEQDELASALADLAKTAQMGPGLDSSADYGPLTNPAQLARADRMVRAAVAAGGRLLAGGCPAAGPGNFLPATVVTDLPPGTELEREEQFAPVIPVLGYEDPAEAIAAANATEYGLGASIWGAPDEAAVLAPALQAGTVWINTHGDLRNDVPFGGTKSSGMGVEYGYWGLLEYTRIQVINSAW